MSFLEAAAAATIEGSAAGGCGVFLGCGSADAAEIAAADFS